MYYKALGNPGLCDPGDNCTIPHGSLENKTGIMQYTGPFKNLQPEYYWSETDYNKYEPESVWYVDFRYGDQREVNKIYPMYGWAVHDGSVGKARVPGKKAKAKKKMIRAVLVDSNYYSNVLII